VWHSGLLDGGDFPTLSLFTLALPAGQGIVVEAARRVVDRLWGLVGRGDGVEGAWVEG
jgi:hypothetical protein